MRRSSLPAKKHVMTRRTSVGLAIIHGSPSPFSLSRNRSRQNDGNHATRRRQIVPRNYFVPLVIRNAPPKSDRGGRKSIARVLPHAPERRNCGRTRERSDPRAYASARDSSPPINARLMGVINFRRDARYNRRISHSGLRLLVCLCRPESHREIPSPGVRRCLRPR